MTQALQEHMQDLKKRNETWVNSDNFQQHKLAIANFVKKYRLTNYGYNYKDFQAMVKRKAYLVNRLKTKYKIPSDKFYGIYTRFFIDANGNMNYCTGQSMNEEMITALECLTDCESVRE